MVNDGTQYDIQVCPRAIHDQERTTWRWDGRGEVDVWVAARVVDAFLMWYSDIPAFLLPKLSPTTPSTSNTTSLTRHDPLYGSFTSHFHSTAWICSEDKRAKHTYHAELNVAMFAVTMLV